MAKENNLDDIYYQHGPSGITESNNPKILVRSLEDVAEYCRSKGKGDYTDLKCEMHESNMLTDWYSCLITGILDGKRYSLGMASAMLN